MSSGGGAASRQSSNSTRTIKQRSHGAKTITLLSAGGGAAGHQSTNDVRTIQEKEFSFSGKEVKQEDDYSIRVTAKDNTEKIRPIVIGDKKKLTDKCSAGEGTALRIVTASLAWVARQVRPGLSYRVSTSSRMMTYAGVSFPEIFLTAVTREAVPFRRRIRIPCETSAPETSPYAWKLNIS